MLLIFNGHKNTLRNPKTNKPLEKGETFEASELWAGQHRPYFNCGAISRVKSEPKKAEPKKRGRPKKAKAE